MNLDMIDLRHKILAGRQPTKIVSPASNGEAIASTKPKLCQVCDRPSFLKCMECDTIYCSSKCQIEDWDTHKDTHNKAKQENSGQQVQFKTSPQGINRRIDQQVHHHHRRPHCRLQEETKDQN